MSITRMMVFSPQDSYLFDIAPNGFFGGSYTEEINGQHSMSLITVQKLEKEQRVLFEDATGKWREYVVTGVDEAHQNNERVFGQYQLVWSLQHDLQLYNIDELIGDDALVSTSTALDIVLSGTLRWNRGNVNVNTYASAEMIMKSGWESLSILLNTWGGEVDADIRVNSTGIVSRRVNVLRRLGSENVTRRFDYSRDLVGFKRNVDESPIACQIVPLGKSEKDFEGFDVPLTIEDVNDGVRYLRNNETAPLFRLPNGNGGWEYTELLVQNTSIEDEEELLEWGRSVLDEYTRPKVTYEAEVLQFVAAGMDARGVELGDSVHCVDREFGEDGVRVEGRVVSVTVDLADPSKTSITVGYLKKSAVSLAMSNISSVKNEVNNLAAGVTYTTEYLNNLLDNLNAEINVTGGWTYITQNEGLIVYDIAVDDPLIGYNSKTDRWASQVVQIKGGNIRIANEKKAAFSGINDWKWKTVIQSGHIAAELVTAAYLTVGSIGNASNGSFWNLDTNELQIATGASLGGTTVSQTHANITSAKTTASNAATAAANAATAASNAAKVATNYLTFNSSNGLDVGYSNNKAKARINGSGMEVFDGSGVSALYAGLSGSNSIVRVGRATGSGNVVMSSEGYVDIRNASTIMAHFGYGEGTNASGGTSIAPYYDIGIRRSGTTVGNYSIAEGIYTTSSGYAAHAEGYDTVASASSAHAEGESTTASSYEAHAEGSHTTASASSAHAEGSYTTASAYEAHAEGYHTTANGKYSHAEGEYTTASGDASHAEGYKTKAIGSHSHAEGYLTEARRSYQHVCGVHNIINLYHLLIVGKGSTSESGSAANAMYLSYEGNLWIAGSLTQNSDRRLKEHHAYLGEDACDFIRALKPALYTKDGARHVGFYAQDVQEAEPDGWDTETVTAQHTDESLDFDPLTLNYQALIAPLVAYTQQLEKRIDKQQETIEALVKRIEALEIGHE